MKSADIDIDLPDRGELLKLIKSTAARLDINGRSHNSGIYVTDIPYDPVHKCSAIDYVSAEHRGYFKIDLLNVGVYKMIRDADHYAAMLNKEPNWARLHNDTAWAAKLIHVGNYTELLSKMKPDSIQRMAAFISIIRPGKAHLQKQPWPDVFAGVWDGDDSKGFIFKKSHSIGYAILVKLHMNLLEDLENNNVSNCDPYVAQE
jgi:hypothetical protein